MPTCFEITAATGRYPVTIAAGALDGVLSEGGERVFIADAVFADQLRSAGIDPIVIVADETVKSLDRMTDVIVALRDRRATRGTTLVAVGGGVVQDVAAFAAAIYMRGIDWVYVPTTLLSMTDSCIGGKSSINVGPYKNIVGTFNPPVAVVVDPALCGTLSAEQVAAGLVEAAKICLCRGPEAFDAYMACDPSISADLDTLTTVVERSLRAKAWFVEIDEFDRAERLILNFGHTFGHAIEAATRFAVGHGIAVGLGMLAALQLGAAMGRDYRGLDRVAAFRTHILDLLGAVDGLDDALATATVPALMDAFESDKKHRQDAYAVIFVAGDGAVERVMLPRDADTRAAVAQAFAAILAEHASQVRSAA